MPVPGGKNGSTDPAGTGTSEPNGEFAELQSLLVGAERRRLDEIERHIHDSEHRARDVGDVLPEAIELRSARDHKLRNALEPILEQSFRTSVRRHPDVLAETLYPVIGAAIRKAVAAALDGMVQTLNQMLEKSFSIDSLKWRLQALRTGKSYGEIMLLNSVRYAVEQVFLIHRETGILLSHVVADSAVVKDADLVSGMLTAIQDFVRDSFGADGAGGLEQMQVGDFTVWIQQGPKAILAGVIRGVPPPELKAVFQRALESVHGDLAKDLQTFRGDTKAFAAAEPTLRGCLLGRSIPTRRPRPLRALAVIGAILIALAVWGFFELRDQRRWNTYVQSLKQQPGIVVTGTARSGGRYTIYGLRDPLSRDPRTLVEGTDINPDRLDLHLEPYLSIQPRFAALRKIDTEREVIEKTLVRFDIGDATLSDAQLDRLEETVAHLSALFETSAALGISAHVEVIGHTDSTGAEVSNTLLAAQRAAAVVADLKTQGIPPDRFIPRGVADTQPVRTGSSEHDQSFNRSVTFRITIAEPAGSPASSPTQKP